MLVRCVEVYCLESDLIKMEVEFDLICVGVEMDYVVWFVKVEEIKVRYLFLCI